MGKLRRYYYENKTKIWKVILIIAFILILIQFANYMVGRKNEKTPQTTNNIVKNTILDNSSLTTDKSAINGGTVSNSQLEEEINIIERFLSLCNNQEFEKAYELVSNECKENLFNNFEKFKKDYCDNIFKTKKSFTTENWAGSTYKVRMAEDILATGQSSSNTMAIQDYITITDNNGQKKLNINNYIGRENFDKETNQKDIIIKILYKDVFMEYETYTIQVKNKTENTIYLDNGEKEEKMYVQDSKGVKHEAAVSELIYSTFKIEAGQTRQYNIKYINPYISNRKIKNIVFENLILNYEKYIKNPKTYTDIISYKIEL